MSSQNSWKWLRADIILAIHDGQLAEHGGLPAIRSPELLDSALARPLNASMYVANADAILVGAMHAIDIAHNRPFIDGNKRVAWVSMRTFLALNGVELAYERVDAVREMLALAAGERSDEQFIGWVRKHATR